MSDPSPLRTRCPHCRKQIAERTKFFPFCSPRCKMADLQKWFTGAHVISQDLDSLTPDQREEIETLEEPDAPGETK